MGHTLSSAAQWTSAEEGGHGKLEFSPFNEVLLKEMIDFVEAISAKGSNESRYVFKHPLVWITEIKPSEFPANYKNKGSEMVSNAVDKNGRPLLVMKLKGLLWEISVRCFEQLDVVIKSAESKKLLEARHCLEANPDPVTSILGNRFATVAKDDHAIYRITHELSEFERSHSEAGLSERKIAINILFQIKALDDALMLKAIKTISGEIKLSPEEVDRSFNVLTKFCGQNPRLCVLKSLSWLEPYTYVFKNGCRAPFWRQLNGDISYLIARPHDGEPISITASTHGYFVNGGMDSGTKVLDFDKRSAYYKDLRTLLRKENAHFDSIIENEAIFSTGEPKADDASGTSSVIATPIASTVKLVDATIADSVVRLSPGDRADTPPAMTERLRAILSGEEAARKVGKKPPKKVTKIEGVEPEREKAHKKKPKKTAGAKKKLYSDESSSDGPDDNDEGDKCIDKFEMPSDYWLIQKYMKFIKGGNPSATTFALCALMDLDLTHDSTQLGIRDVGGVELLINLLESKDLRCQIGSLHVLKKISENCAIRQFITDLGGIQIMVRLLRCQDSELKCLAAETIAHVAQFKRARRIVRRNNGICNLIALLDIGHDRSLSRAEELEQARCGALAIFSCCKSHTNKTVMRRAGIIPILGKLLWQSDPETLIPVVGILHECAQELIYLVSIRTEGMLGNILKHLKEEKSIALQTVCASALFVCAREKETRVIIRQLGGLKHLVDIVAAAKDKKLIEEAAGAIWKCAISEENCKDLHKLSAVTHLVKILNIQPEEPEEVLVNVVGALGEMAKVKVNSKEIRQANGIPALVNLLKKTNTSILVNASKAVGYCAEDFENMVLINKLDGVALIWSLLKNKNEEVQASAARALCPCIQNAQDSGEMVRSFIGGLEFVVRLLKSNNSNVLASACAVIASIALDEENLAVLTDHGVVPMLARLVCANIERERRHLCEAIANCCSWSDNRTQFGKEDAVRPLVRYLKTADEEVLCSCTRALYELSKDPDNCITMHDVDVVKRMLELVASRNKVIQISAAGCISNIRRLALANENYYYQRYYQQH